MRKSVYVKERFAIDIELDSYSNGGSYMRAYLVNRSMQKDITTSSSLSDKPSVMKVIKTYQQEIDSMIEQEDSMLNLFNSLKEVSNEENNLF